MEVVNAGLRLLRDEDPVRGRTPWEPLLLEEPTGRGPKREGRLRWASEQLGAPYRFTWRKQLWVLVALLKAWALLQTSGP